MGSNKYLFIAALLVGLSMPATASAISCQTTMKATANKKSASSSVFLDHAYLSRFGYASYNAHKLNDKCKVATRQATVPACKKVTSGKFVSGEKCSSKGTMVINGNLKYNVVHNYQTEALMVDAFGIVCTPGKPTPYPPCAYKWLNFKLTSESYTKVVAQPAPKPAPSNPILPRYPSLYEQNLR